MNILSELNALLTNINVPYLEKSDSLQTLIPVMNDMIVQQYGINSSQENAVNIATMLGKVMNGQVGALSRYGYTFDEVQENILKFGTEAERAAVLAEVVGESVGGMNEALASTDLGKMSSLETILDNTKIKVGEVANDFQAQILGRKAIAAKFSSAVANLINHPDRGAKTREGNGGADYYGVIRAAVAAGCIHVFLMESGFHDNWLDEEFLLKDENLKRIAEVQAQVILDALGVKGGLVNTNAPVSNDKVLIMGKSVLTAEQLAAWLLSKNANPKINCTALELARLFISEGNTEGVRGDIAFCQSIHETGWFKYGGLVLPEQNNYAGIGATNNSDVGKGAWFDSPQLGVRGQIHHLKAYASKEPLKNENASPRFHLVTRGIAPAWVDLNGRWAVPGTTYGQGILKLFNDALAFAAKQSPAPATKPTPEQIINTLSGKVNISSPEHWVNVLHGKQPVNIEFLNILFGRLAGFDV